MQNRLPENVSKKACSKKLSEQAQNRSWFLRELLLIQNHFIRLFSQHRISGRKTA